MVAIQLESSIQDEDTTLPNGYTAARRNVPIKSMA